MSDTNIDYLFKEKELLHKERAKLSFEEKIKILVRLQRIAQIIKPSSKKICKAWETDSY